MLQCVRPAGLPSHRPLHPNCSGVEMRNRKRNMSTANFAEWFWSMVRHDADGCWRWLGGSDGKGYGRVWEGRRYTRAHRRAYELENGAIPTGLWVLHRCDHPRCCNPAHLWLGTNADNTADRGAKGRSARGDTHGARRHPDRRTRGTTHGQSKLTVVDIVAIRAFRSSGLTYAAIGRMFSISQTQARSIALNHQWKHVE